MPSSKRHMSDNSTPKAQSQKKARTDQVPKLFSDTLIAIKMTIVPQDFPGSRPTEEQFDQIQLALLDVIQPGSGLQRQDGGGVGTSRSPNSHATRRCIAESRVS